MERNKISIIVPVYNAEKYIERCVRSLFGQTLNEIEFIFVDDCSPDNSIQLMEKVLNDYPKRRSQVKIIKHKKNKGPSSARNSGIDAASGEYITFCDSDDWCELDMYEKLYNEAQSTNCDICWCDFYMHRIDRDEIVQALDAVSDKQQLLKAYITSGWTSLWNMLVKRSIYEKYHIRGYAGFCFCEDYALAIQLLYYASGVAHVKRALYHYNRMNTESIVSTSLSKKNIERTTDNQVEIYSRINEFFKEKGLYLQLQDVLSYRMLCGKRGWLMNKNKRKEYRALYPESNAYIWSNPLCSMKDKICQFIIIRPFLSFLLPIIKIITQAIKYEKNTNICHQHGRV